MSRPVAYTAKLEISTKFADHQTYPANTYYTPPFKLTNFFRRSNGGIEYMLMNASAGIMAHDDYSINLELAEHTQLLISAQAFEKIHSMPSGEARRHTKITLAANSCLIFNPLPNIPFANSAFTTTTDIHLATATSRLIYSEIISSGRSLRNENFVFRNYTSLLNIYLAKRLVYRDNCQLNPTQQDLTTIGMFEQATHLGNFIFYGFELAEKDLDRLQQILNESQLDCAISQLVGNGYLIRVLATGSEATLTLFKALINQLAECASAI